MTSNTHEWVILHHKGFDITEKLRVSGGWLFRTRLCDRDNGPSLALTFVADPPKPDDKS